MCVTPGRTAPVGDSWPCQMLKMRGETACIDLVDDARDGLFLCPCDIFPKNFKKRENVDMWAIDFGASHFLPPCFMAAALKIPTTLFAADVAKYLEYPMSKNVAILRSVAGLQCLYIYRVDGQCDNLLFHP